MLRLISAELVYGLLIGATAIAAPVAGAVIHIYRNFISRREFETYAANQRADAAQQAAETAELRGQVTQGFVTLNSRLDSLMLDMVARKPREMVG